MKDELLRLADEIKRQDTASIHRPMMLDWNERLRALAAKVPDGWVMDALHIHNTVAKRWPVFGDEDKRFLVLALCGEAGELANEVKKDWRDQGDRREKIAEECVDVRIYLELIAHAYGFDLDTECAKKIPELYRRWPEVMIAAAPKDPSP